MAWMIVVGGQIVAMQFTHTPAYYVPRSRRYTVTFVAGLLETPNTSPIPSLRVISRQLIGRDTPVRTWTRTMRLPILQENRATAKGTMPEQQLERAGRLIVTLGEILPNNRGKDQPCLVVALLHGAVKALSISSGLVQSSRTTCPPFAPLHRTQRYQQCSPDLCSSCTPNTPILRDSQDLLPYQSPYISNIRTSYQLIIVSLPD